MTCLVFSPRPWIARAKTNTQANLKVLILRTHPVNPAVCLYTALRALKPVRTRAQLAKRARKAMTLRFSMTANSSLEMVSERGGGGGP